MDVMQPPTNDELRSLLTLKHGDVSRAGWGVRRRAYHQFFTPDDWYETLVRRLVTPATRWLDVGGGASIFPHDAPLATELARRAKLLVGVDPSDNIHANPFVHERWRGLIEDYQSPHQFDLATLRMVAEHVADPPRVIAKLRDLIAPDGHVVIYTVNRWSPITLVSTSTPHGLHHPLKRLFWGGEDKDTFPVAYKMNSRRELKRLFLQGSFDEVLFQHLDDLATFSQIKPLNWLELKVWRVLRALRLGYPENCLLGVYRRATSVRASEVSASRGSR